MAVGKLDAGDAASARDRIVVGTDLDALADVELCVEAATEDEALLAHDDVILASDTSSVPIMKLGSVTRRPEVLVPAPSTLHGRVEVSDDGPQDAGQVTS